MKRKVLKAFIVFFVTSSVIVVYANGVKPVDPKSSVVAISNPKATVKNTILPGSVLSDEDFNKIIKAVSLKSKWKEEELKKYAFELDLEKSNYNTQKSIIKARNLIIYNEFYGWTVEKVEDNGEGLKLYTFNELYPGWDIFVLCNFDKTLEKDVPALIEFAKTMN